MSDVWQKIADGSISLREMQEMAAGCVPMPGTQLGVHGEGRSRFEIGMVTCNHESKIERFVDGYTDDPRVAQFFARLSSVTQDRSALNSMYCVVILQTGRPGVGWTLVVGE